MKHTLRLNVYRKGYTLFSGHSSFQYDEFPLDIISDGISRNYLAVQKRIDALLETQISRWHFGVANLDSHERPVVAYGCLLPIEDDKGRTGVSFIHAIESDEFLGIDDILVCIAQVLSHQIIGEISKSLAGLAKGTETSQHVIKFLTNQFVRVHGQPKSLSEDKSRPIKEIQHDCGGAPAVAWLAMTISHLGDSSTWEIYEEYKPHKNIISTVSSCANASERYLLSEYLYQLIRDHELLENLYTLRSGSRESRFPTPNPEKTQSGLGIPTSNPTAYENPLNDTEKIRPQEAGRIRKPPESKTSSSYNQQYAEANYRSENQQGYYPPNSHIVRMDGLFGNELSLIENTHKYRLNNKNCFSISDGSSHYEFIVVRPKWFGFFEEKVILVLPKHVLTEQQIKEINRFYQYASTANDHFMR